MTKISHISCVIIAKDAALTIAATLDSLLSFEEVILYLNNTSDETEKIASEYANATVIHGEFLGFGPTKNAAATYAKKSWILSLDADEALEDELLTSLQTLNPTPKTLYALKRETYDKKRLVKHGWGEDTILRLYNKDETAFTDSHVHEHLISEGFKVETLDGKLSHFPYANITDFITKLERYSSIYAKDNAGKKSSSPTKAFFNGLFSFLKTYFLKRGFLDGYAGLLIAFSHMATNFYKYLKLYELNEEIKNKKTKE